ncbi:MAG: adenylate/guanylate cyclase [Nocardioidaceae bacterium]|jgi:class 3 adenylate cyclase|nr:adenylate/guanylate cyclase [Nocardioidaceae bacterium]
MDLRERDGHNASQRAPARGAAGLVGLVGTIEDPATISRLVNLVGMVAAATTAGFGVLFFAFDEQVAGWSTLGLSFASLICWLVLVTGRLAGRVVVAVAVVTAASAANHIVVHVALGGFAHSGGYLFGGLVLTLMVGLALPRSATGLLALAYCGVAVALGLNEAGLAASRPAPAAPLSTILFVTVFTSAFFMLVPMFGYSLEQLAAERARAEALLLNILPETIAGRLKTRPGMIADRHEECSVVFADLVGFTAHSKGKDPAQIVGELNTIFSRFDAIAAKHRAEKIKTIGDGYLAACGLPDADPDHVAQACDLALAMVEAMPVLNSELGTHFQLRVGVNAGSAVAGIVGSSKFSYDVWGDMVNLASRLESTGTPGVVVTSAAVVSALQGRYTFQPLGAKDLKGEGMTELFAVVGAHRVV